MFQFLLQNCLGVYTYPEDTQVAHRSWLLALIQVSVERFSLEGPSLIILFEKQHLTPLVTLHSFPSLYFSFWSFPSLALYFSVCLVSVTP